MTTFCSFFFKCYGNHRDLHSFPTRRSSDLPQAWAALAKNPANRRQLVEGMMKKLGGRLVDLYYHFGDFDGTAIVEAPDRSEEHTSELQSRLHLVCRLLLEKKTNPHVIYLAV